MKSEIAEKNILHVAERLRKYNITSSILTDAIVGPVLNTTNKPDSWLKVYNKYKAHVKKYLEVLENVDRLEQIDEKDLPDLLSHDDRLDLLTAAMEGGSNYWYFFRYEVNPAIGEPDGETPLVDRIYTALKNGHTLYIHEIEDDVLLGAINMRSIREGERKMQKDHPYHFADVVAENADAITGDVWFQYAVMGALVYG